MTNEKQKIVVPKFWQPWPHQIDAWRRLRHGGYKYYFELWSRQSGKDTTYIQVAQNKAFWTPGCTSVYIGLDNVWINENIFKKRIDGRDHWADYEDVGIKVNATNKEVAIRNTKTPKEVSDSRIKFIGFLNDQQLIGSSYDNWYISEASLYKDDAFVYIQPIWQQQEAMGKLSTIAFNGTPRGIRNVYYELLRTYTGMEDPDDFPGEHGDCYVDKKTIHDIIVPDGHGGWRKLYTEEEIEKLKDRIYRQYGNLNYYYQEYECKFTTVNAGLVYQGIEQLTKEKRYTPINIDTRKPVYMAWDIASKGKMTDASACIIFQFINNQMMIYDYYEARGKSLVECIADIAEKPYFKHIRLAALPWDSERSASSETPIEEAKRMYPNITWHALERERVDRGIQLVREQLPNMIINSDKCSRLYDAFLNYEYKFIEKQGDWTAQPVHNWASHAMDGMRYAAMLLGEMNYLRMNDDGSPRKHLPYYGRRAEQYQQDKYFKSDLFKVEGRRHYGRYTKSIPRWKK